MKARGKETMSFYVLFIRWLLPALSELDTASQQYLNMKSRRMVSYFKQFHACLVPKGWQQVSVWHS